MADVNSSEDEGINAFFGNSDDDDDDFERFTEEDKQYIRRNIIENVPMSDFSPENDWDIAEDLDAGWSRDDADVVLTPFTGEPTLNVDMGGKLPIDFFKLFVDDYFLHELTTETNLYAGKKLDNPDLKEHSRLKKWQPVSVDEMKVFLALVIAMGLVQKSDIQQYWSSDETHETPFFKKHMSRDRFLAILSNFHLNNNDLQVQRGQVGFDPLYKIRPFLNVILDRFSEVYSPEQNLRFKVYNPAKPSKFGIKLYQVCEANSGYCIGFNIYTGNSGSSCVDFADTILGEENECSTTTRIVLGLMARCGLLDKGHHVYMDNYYTSPELFKELYLQDTYACGTLQKNRLGLPVVLKKPTMKLKQSETIYRRNECLLAVKYHDKGDVHMLSTIHEATVSILDKADRNTNQHVAKPTCIADYDALMGGVDLSNQINQYCSCLRKTSKWYKKLFFHLLNVCIINAYLLFKKFGPNESWKKDHYAFRMSVSESLLSEAVTAPRPCMEKGRKSTRAKPARLTERHFPNYIPAKPGAKRARPVRDCIACNVTRSRRDTAQRRQTSFWCEECNVALCVPKCFQIYHTIKNYRGVLLPGQENVSSSDSE